MNQLIFFIKRVVIIFFLSPLYFFSKFIPRKRNLAVFGSFHLSFLDNSKYLFLQAQEYQELKSIWISGKKETVDKIRSYGFIAYRKWSLRGIYYCLTAKYYFYSAYITDINLWTSGGATAMNLWHGTPLKAIEFDIKSGEIANRFNGSLVSRIKYSNIYRKANYIASTNREVSEVFQSAFRLTPDQCLEFGYPRTDIFFKSESEIIKHINIYETGSLKTLLGEIKNFKHKYIYMPTWRDDNSDFIKAGNWDLKKLNEIMVKTDSIFLFKMHVNTNWNSKIIDNFSNIKAIDNAIDVYPLLPFTTCLITDYSSIFIDYLLLDKEIIFFPFDKDNYLKMRPDFYFDYDELTDGLQVTENKKLLQLLEKPEKNNTSLSRKKLKKMFWNKNTPNASKKILEHLIGNC